MEKRRAFFHKLLALSALPPATSSAAPRRPLPPTPTRQSEALHIRQSTALQQAGQPPSPHPANTDETALPNHIGNFTKGLPHLQSGEVQAGAYETLLHALTTGNESDFEALDRGSGAKFVNPLAAYGFQMEGADSHSLGMPAPPAFASPEAAAEMVELYWQALARDVPFTDYPANPTLQSAAADLAKLSAFHGPQSPAAIFRSKAIPNTQTGPYISQFLWQPVPVNSTVVEQRYRSGLPAIDYLATWDEWLVIQSGLPPFRAWAPDPQPRYIHNGRSLAEWVHYDFLYQAFHNAALILLNESPDSILNTNPYLSPTNPYKTTKVEKGFVTFGSAHICCLLGTVTQAALMAAWFQKWLIHRRLRPEEFGGRLHSRKTGATTYPIHPDLLNSAALPAVFKTTGTYLLPQAYPEGCPLHPSYPSGHATVAGACSAVLKAFFDESLILTNTVTSSADGTALNPYYDTALTVGAELDKLAFNIAMGRNWAGIHYRTDAEAGIRLGEDVAISILQDLTATYAETFTGFRFTRADGTQVQIPPSTT